MNNSINIITANFSNNGRQCITRKLYQYDYGQKISIRGLSLPNTFQVHISNDNNINTAEVYIGHKNEIEIPDKFLLTGSNIYMWIFLHKATEDGETRYMITTPVEERPKPQAAVPSVDNNTINELLIEALQNDSNKQPKNLTGINIITVNFNGKRDSITRKLYQYDYGQIINIKDLDLPNAFEVHISNSNKASNAEIYIGDHNQIEIPDKYLTSGEDIYIWIFLHSSAEDGETRYTITIPVKKKPKPEGQEPTPVEKSSIDQLIAALETNLNEMQAATENAKNQMQQTIHPDNNCVFYDFRDDLGGGQAVNNWTTQMSNIAPYQWELQSGKIPHFYSYYISSIAMNRFMLYVPPDTDENTEFQAVVQLATPLTYQLDAETLRTIKGENNIWGSTNGNTEVTYWKH